MDRRTLPPSGRPSSADWAALTRTYDVEGLRLTQAFDRWIVEGQVPCYRTKKELAAAIVRLVGPGGVLNRLRVIPQGHRSDHELAEAARAVLGQRLGPACGQFTVSARQGVVVLRGQVPSSGARCEAEAAVWALRGVIDVVNRLGIRPNGSPLGHSGVDAAA